MAFTRYKNRRGLAAEWVFHNPILADGELGFEKDTNFVKIGDGSTNWVNLPYLKNKELLDHLTDTSDAHDASAISVTPFGDIVATDVQSALAELDSEKSSTGHTHAAVASGVKSTVGAVLPTFSGRVAGDLHYNTSDTREYVLTGIGGAAIKDDFNRANGTTLTTTSSGATWIIPTGIGPSIVNNKATNAAANQDTAVYVDTGSNDHEISADYTVVASFSNARLLFRGGQYEVFFGGQSGSLLGINIIKSGTTLATSTGNLPTQVIGRTYKISAYIKGGAFVALLTDPVAGTFVSLSYTDPSPATGATPTRAGFRILNTNDTLDNFETASVGTLAWTSTDEYVATHTHTAGSTSTNGAGLPSFTGRKAGDQHYNTTTRTEHTLTGVAGRYRADTFDRANTSGAGLGTSSSGTAWVLPVATAAAEQIQIVNGKAVPGTSDNRRAMFDLNDTSQFVSMDVTPTATDSRPSILLRYPLSGSGYELEGVRDASGKMIVRIAEDGANMVYFTSTMDFVVGRTYRHEASMVGNVLTFTIYDLTAGTSVTQTFTDTTPKTGTYVGINFPTLNGQIDNFESLSVGTLAWTDMSLNAQNRASIASLTSIGAGLPPFSGRIAGDGHFNTDINRLHVLTGVAGATQADTFNRADGNLVGSTTETGAKTWVSGLGASQQPTILNGQVKRKTGSVDAIAYIDTGVAGSRSVSATITMSASGDGNGQNIYIAAPNSSASGDFYTITFDKSSLSVGKNGTGAASLGVYNYPVGQTQAAGSTANYAASLTVNTDGSVTIAVSRENVLLLTATDTTPGTRGTTHQFVGIKVVDTQAANSGAFDNFETQAIGSQKWEASEPVYLQAQLATGTVATGTHVLKPGMRVPAACTLKEIVLRCETAPVGASITVAVERFNNGVSAGIIGTASIPTGENVGSAINLTGGCAKGDILKFNITSVGSTTAGADLTISLDLR